MRPAPAQLVEGLSDSDVYVAQKWWCQLTEDVQGDLTILFDPNQDSCRVRSNEITIIVNSELLCDDDENTDDWADFYEYMLDHPEVFPPYVPIDRTFVIWMSQLQARHSLGCPGGIGKLLLSVQFAGLPISPMK